jgi:cobalt/nickel transport system permease protein
MAFFIEKGKQMHIPDGYLGPQTYGTLYGLMFIIWAKASKKVKETVNKKNLPLLALASAFSFVIMMFNIPVPGGSTGHAVGAAIIAITLGPWAAVISISVSLIIQALLFSDGGITAIAANCFTMAFVMPFTAYYIYRFLSGKYTEFKRRQAISAAIAGYVSINLSALTTAILIGIQPLIAKQADGTPLYSPYSLKVTIPAMTIEHLLFFGFIEAVVTGLVCTYLARQNIIKESAYAKSALEKGV